VESPTPLAEDRFKKPFRFRCTQCGACCADKTTLVNLTFWDLDRFQQQLDLDVDGLLDIIGFYVFETAPTPDQLKKMVLPPIPTEHGPAFMALKKNPDGKCIYLNEDNRCKIYTARPDICRCFPFHFHSSPGLQPQPKLDITMTIAEKAKQYCPGFGLPAPFVKPKDWMTAGSDTIRHILSEHILIKKFTDAVNANKITPTARNYLLTVVELNEQMKESAAKKKVTYKVRVQEKIKKMSLEKK
jgi:Fe-S-cluster containining protein